MLQAIYTAVTGMKTQQENIAVIGNNMANINTVSFKSSRTDFADALYSQLKRSVESGDYQQRGAGVLFGASQRILMQGESLGTANPMDFMIDGPGYFTLAGTDGEPLYTRNGAFRVSVVDGAGFLVTADGYYVLGSDNRPVQVPDGSAEFSVDEAGNLSQNGVRFASLKISEFPNPAGLIDAGSNKYLASDASGQATAAGQMSVVRQGWLEGSNVDMSAEMVRLIRSQRAFSVLGSAIRTADEMEQQANSMMK